MTIDMTTGSDGLSAEAVEQLRGRVRGALILPGDKGYDEARHEGGLRGPGSAEGQGGRWVVGPRPVKLLLGAVLVGLGLVALGGGGGAQAAYPGDNGRIAFTSERHGNQEIYSMASDGSGVVRLTTNTALDSDPVWSPDGTRIAFTSTRDGNYEVYSMAPDGSDVVRLTTDARFDGLPAWSPDGARIAFTSTRDGNDEIYSMAADGADPRRLTNDVAFDAYPAWSPDGARIAFTSTRDGNPEIYTMAPDGSGAINLTSSAADDSRPVWSPDGLRIAFTSTRDGNSEIYSMAADGADPRRLTNDVAFDAYPAWSPDGTRIAFTSGRDGAYEIYSMAADGSDPVRLTDNSSLDLWPDWQPVPTPPPPAPPPPPPPPPSPPSPPPAVDACGTEGAPGYLYPAKMRVLRSRVLRSERRLDVLAPITARARGGEVEVTYRADRRSDTFSAEVTSGDAALDRIRFKQPITRGQARLGTGIVTLDYQGDADTRPEVVRLRAASQSADLEVEEISLLGDRLSAKGSVTGRAQGIVRFRYSYLDAAGHPQIYPARATIQDDGDWELQDDVVPPQLARCGGYLSILFTGYFERRIRGEMLAYELNAGQTRRP